MSSSPGSRTSTFLMTDIEGSTRLWEEQPVAMAVALAATTRSSATPSQARRHGGQDHGDGLLAVFDEPAAAVRAALAGQRALLRRAWADPSPLRVRMALHSGTAETRDGDYFGPALNRVARLLGDRPRRPDPRLGDGAAILVGRPAARRGPARPGRPSPARTSTARSTCTSWSPRACRPTSRRSARARRRRTSRPS